MSGGSWFQRISVLTLFFFGPFFAPPATAAQAGSESVYPERRWGIGIGLRYADSPFAAANQTVTDVVPLFFYEGERFFLNGVEGGLMLFGNDAWRLHAYARYRFMDFPRELENDIRTDTWDIGLQLRHAIYGGWDLRSELLTDGGGRVYLDVGTEALFGDDYASLRPYVGVRAKSARFNDLYFGLGGEELGAGVDFHARVEGRRHLAGNLYALGRLGGYYLGRDARRTERVRDSFAWETFVGIAFFNDPDRRRKSALRTNAYWRLAHGWATPTSLGDILRWRTEEDPHNNQLTSLFYGHPLADELFGLPLDIYLTPGLAFHHPSDVQGSSFEYVVAIKAYYTFRWPVRLRIGLAEGLSYTTQVPFVERSKLEERDFRPSKLLNFLDVSLDVNLGDVFGARASNLWLGYSIHHRSGIFETGSQFGHIHGGSNFNTVYLQWHF